MTRSKLPAYVALSAIREIELDTDNPSVAVRFILPNDIPQYCRPVFHISDPEAAATLIEHLQPLADRVPKPRVVTRLGDDEKDAVWLLSYHYDWYYMWSPRGWLMSEDDRKTWTRSVNSNPYVNDGGNSFVEVFN